MPDVSIEAAMRDDFKDFYNCWTVKALSGIKCVSPNSICCMMLTAELADFHMYTICMYGASPCQSARSLAHPCARTPFTHCVRSNT